MPEKTNKELEQLFQARKISFEEYQALLERKRQNNREKQRRRKERLAAQKNARNEDILRIEERYTTTLSLSVKMATADYAKATGVPQGIVVERALIEYMSRYWPETEDESAWAFYRPLPGENQKPAPVCIGKGAVRMALPSIKKKREEVSR